MNDTNTSEKVSPISTKYLTQESSISESTILSDRVSKERATRISMFDMKVLFDQETDIKDLR